jgi:hypothetical protein
MPRIEREREGDWGLGPKAPRTEADRPEAAGSRGLARQGPGPATFLGSHTRGVPQFLRFRTWGTRIFQPFRANLGCALSSDLLPSARPRGNVRESRRAGRGGLADSQMTSKPVEIAGRRGTPLDPGDGCKVSALNVFGRSWTVAAMGLLTRGSRVYSQAALAPPDGPPGIPGGYGHSFMYTKTCGVSGRPHRDSKVLGPEFLSLPRAPARRRRKAR